MSERRMAYEREGLGEARGRQFADPGAALQRTARTRSADRDAVLQTALYPERVKAALDLERRTLADVALEDFAVVAHVLDDPHHQSLVRPVASPNLPSVPRRRLISGLSDF